MQKDVGSVELKVGSISNVGAKGQSSIREEAELDGWVRVRFKSTSGRCVRVNP